VCVCVCVCVCVEREREREGETEREREKVGVLINRVICCCDYKASKTDESDLGVQHS